MFEKFILVLEKIAAYLVELPTVRVADFTLVDAVVVTAMAAGVFFFVKYAMKAFMKYGIRGLMIASRPVVIIYVEVLRRRQEKRICHTCKNPLDRCVCPVNRGVSYRKRVSKWKIKEKSIRQAAKLQKLESIETNKPVVLKKKKSKNGGR